MSARKQCQSGSDLDATSTLPQLFFELRFAVIQRLQSQLPAMQLDRELIDVAGNFGTLRFIFSQLSPDFFRVSQRIHVRLLRFRNGGQLAALLAGQHHAGGRSIHDQRGFAMLAMEEDVGISRDFAEGMSRRFHDQITSSRYAAAQRKI